MRAPALWVFAAVAAGVSLAEGLGGGAAAWGVAVAAAAVVVLLLLRRGRGVAVASLAALAATGGWAAALERAPAPLAPSCEAPRWRGVVSAPVDRTAGPGDEAQLTVLDALEEGCGGAWQPRTGRAAVSLPATPEVARGDRLVLDAPLAPPPPRLNPVGLDPELEARREQLAAVGRASQHAVDRPGGGLGAWLDHARARAALVMGRGLRPEVAPLARAFATGDLRAIAPVVRDRWADAGTAHLLAVSGLQVAIVTWLLLAACRAVLVRIPGLVERLSAPRLAAVLAMPPTVLFGVWAGAGPSVMRATVMALAALGGTAIARPSSTLNALGIAGAAILLFDPLALYDLGFVLSFAGVAALLALPPAARDGPWWRRAGRALLIAVAASVAATLTTAPASAWAFGAVSLVAPLTNLVAVPLSSLVAVPLAMLYAALAVLGLDPSLLTWPLETSIVVLDELAAAAARLPWAWIVVPQPTRWEVAAYALALVAAAVALRTRGGWRRAGYASALFVAVVGARAWPTPPALRLLHPYVGQGDAAVVTFPDASVMLFDAGGAVFPGGWDPGRGVVAPLLRSLGVRVIDLAVLSHADPDHLGGFAYVAERFPIRELWWSGKAGEQPQVAALVERVRQQGGVVHTAADLPPVLERGGAVITWLHPRPAAAGDLPYYPDLSDNDNAVVLHLRYGARSFLLPGDIEAEGERLVGAVPPPRVDVLKAPHHGSRTSSSAAWLAALQPQAVVISCGVANRFGFPAPEVLARYAAAGLQVLRTDRDGLIEARTDGVTWELKGYRGGAVSLPAR